MSSEEENRFYNNEETVENSLENEKVPNLETGDNLDDLSAPSDVNSEINVDALEEAEQTTPSHELEGRIGVDELPLSGNTKSFQTKFESAPTEEERRAERRRERRRRRKLIEEDDGPNEGSAKSTVNKFEKGEIDDVHFQKTDTTNDSMAASGTVSSTKARFKAGNVNVSSDSESKTRKQDDKEVVESGTAASRRKALEEYAEEARKSKSANSKVLEEDGVVLRPGSAASTRAKLERMSSEEKVLEKEIDNNAPKRGTASERRAKFEERARKSSSSDESSKHTTRTERRSKWPEPKTNYRQRRAQLKTSFSTDEETVEKENAKNIEKSNESEEKANNIEKSNESEENAKNIEKSNDSEVGDHKEEESAKPDSTQQSSTEEEPKSPVRTADIRRKLVKMLSEEEKAPPIDRIGNARPSSGTARNLRAKFEAGRVKQEESHYGGKKPSISSRSGYASRVRERFESGEVSRRRTSSTADEVDGDKAVDGDTSSRRRRTSSSRSIEGEGIIMSRSAKELRNRFENPTQTSHQVKRNFVLRSRTPASSLSSKFNKSGPSSNKCTYCSKTVYPVEMITADDKPFHKFCFKCTECKATLRLGNYAALQGKIYCKPHFKQLFKVKGNYDEGFGRQQHKKHWEEKQTTPSEKSNEIDANSNVKSASETDKDLVNGYEESNVSVDQTNGHRTLNNEDPFDEEIEA